MKKNLSNECLIHDGEKEKCWECNQFIFPIGCMVDEESDQPIILKLQQFLFPPIHRPNERYVEGQDNGTRGFMGPRRVAEELRKVYQKYKDARYATGEIRIHDLASEAGYAIENLLAFTDMIAALPTCNDCARPDCVYKPMLGETVRYNCPHHFGQGLIDRGWPEKKGSDNDD